MGSRNAIDWGWIEANVPAECRVVCTDYRGLYLLLSMVEQLSWRATYLDGQSYDASAWDAIETLADELDHDLRCSMGCNDLITAIGGSGISNFTEPTNYDGPGPTGTPIGDTSENVQGTGDPDDPTTWPVNDAIDADGSGTLDQSEVDAYLCAVANLLVDTAINSLKTARMLLRLGMGFERLLDQFVWVIIRAAAAVSPGTVDDIIFWGIDEFTDLWVDEWEALSVSALDTAITDLENARNDMVCAVVGGATAADMASILINELNTQTAIAVASAFITSFPWAVLTNLAFAGQLYAKAGTCDCDPIDQFVDMYAEDPLSATLVSWNAGQPSDPTINGDIVRVYFNRGVTVEITFPAAQAGYRLVGLVHEEGAVVWNGGTESLHRPDNHVDRNVSTFAGRESASVASGAHSWHYANDPVYASWWDALWNQTSSIVADDNVHRIEQTSYSGADAAGGQYLEIRWRALYSTH